MSGVAIIELEYNWQDHVIKEHDIEKVRARFPWLFVEKDDEVKPRSSWDVADRVSDSEEMQDLSEHGVIFKVKRFKGVVPWGNRQDFPKNASVQLHLPNYVLTSFNKVIVEEDCCTDNLQKRLDEGWRIIAVCPPLNARRPDYVLAKVEN
jgi:hypothetical protein